MLTFIINYGNKIMVISNYLIDLGTDINSLIYIHQTLRRPDFTYFSGEEAKIQKVRVTFGRMHLYNGEQTSF